MILARSWTLFLVLLAPPTAHSSTVIPGPVSAEYLSAYDGDTVTVRAWIWPGQSVETAVRVRGIDTPEIMGKCEAEKIAAVAAREAARTILSGGRQIELRDIENDKYGGRVLASVTVDGRDLAALMITTGLARAYKGGNREDWCSG